jgi:hypothetical protein
MSSSYEYSLCYELEYSHVSIFMIYELEYSPYVMFISYLAQCFIIHTMFMNRFRLILRWWFIILSGTLKSFTYRSVGSGTRGTWVVSMYVGKVPRYIRAGVNVLELGVPRTGQVNDAVRQSLRWLCKADTRCILVQGEHPYVQCLLLPMLPYTEVLVVGGYKLVERGMAPKSL